MHTGNLRYSKLSYSYKITTVRWVDVRTSLGAKVGVLRNVSPEFGKGKKRQINLLAIGNGNSVNG
jgi:hypothetical protein